MGRGAKCPTQPTSPDEPVSDDELLRRIRDQDVGAFEVLYRRYYVRIFRFLLRLSQRTDIVEEAVNDTMVAVWRHAASFDGRSRPSTWLFGIAYNTAIKALKRRGRDKDLVDLEGEDLVETTSPEDVAEASGSSRRVRAAVAALSPKHRVVVELTYFHGYRYGEIAELLGCPEDTVKTRMFHARARLRHLLEEREPVRGREMQTARAT